MPVYEPFFKRKMRERGEFPTTFQTEKMPEQLKGQLKILLEEMTGPFDDKNTPARELLKMFKREANTSYRDATIHNLLSYLFDFPGRDEHIMSAFEFLVHYTIAYKPRNTPGPYNTTAKSYYPKISPQIALEEINQRFKENGYGYQIENKQIVSMDSEYTHNEIIVPTVSLLINDKFEGALDEFMRAFDAFKNNNNDECIRLCANAFESTLKQIHHEQGWPLPNKQTADPLLESAKTHGLFPTYMTTHFTALLATLKAGMPTLRNNAAGHGSGVDVRETEEHVARYALNLTATNILFLISSHKSLQKSQASSAPPSTAPTP